MAKQVTIRGVSPDLAKRLKALASAEGESVNTTVLRLLEAATGLDSRRKRLARYSDWTDADLAEFNDSLASQRKIDADLWK